MSEEPNRIPATDEPDDGLIEDLVDSLLKEAAEDDETDWSPTERETGVEDDWETEDGDDEEDDDEFDDDDESDDF